jgi:hypothetical protein
MFHVLLCALLPTALPPGDLLPDGCATPACPVVSPGARPLPDVVLGVKACGGAEAARFAARLAERFPFLRADR